MNHILLALALGILNGMVLGMALGLLIAENKFKKSGRARRKKLIDEME